MHGDTRSQSGLDRLVLFILFLVAVVAITPFVFGLGGIDVRATGDTTSATPTPTGPATDEGIVILSATGETAGFGGESVGVVRVVITKTGAETLDTAAMTATWVDAGGSYVLTAPGEGASGADGAFAIAEADGRAVLTFDLGRDDADSVGEFGRRLEAGETVTLSLTTGDGQTTTVTLEVPDSLGDEETVRL
ncbi:hypothetical protein [Salinibaculum salinum]|uniref:hypothetical protein n=1 Tax=Salinibaculum salinum TaxID=3131996 RepID=UPI0030EC8A54